MCLDKVYNTPPRRYCDDQKRLVSPKKLRLSGLVMMDDAPKQANCKSFTDLIIVFKSNKYFKFGLILIRPLIFVRLVLKLGSTIVNQEGLIMG